MINRMRGFVVYIIVALLCFGLISTMTAKADGSGYLTIGPGDTVKIDLGLLQDGTMIYWYLDIYSNYSYSGIAYYIELPNMTNTPIEYMTYYYIYDQYVTDSDGIHRLVISNTLPTMIDIYYSYEVSLLPDVIISSPSDGEINPQTMVIYQSGYPLEVLPVQGMVTNLSSSEFGDCHDLYLYLDDIQIYGYHFHPYSETYPWTISVTMSLLDEGEHEIRVEVTRGYSSYNPVAEAAITIILDFGMPEVEILSPIYGSWINSSDQMLIWNGSDSGAGISEYAVKIDKGPWISVGLSEEWNLSVIQDGVHNISVKATDYAGNKNIQSVELMMDCVSPVIAKLSPAKGSTVISQPVIISWDVNDATSGIDHIEIQVDGGSWINVANADDYQIDGLGAGSHTVAIKAVDRAGNIDMRTTQFSIDTNAMSFSGPYSGLPTLFLIAIIIIAVLLILGLKGKNLLGRNKQPPKNQ